MLHMMKLEGVGISLVNTVYSFVRTLLKMTALLQ